MSRVVAIFHERFRRAEILRFSKSGFAKFDEESRARTREPLERGARWPA